MPRPLNTEVHGSRTYLRVLGATVIHLIPEARPEHRAQQAFHQWAQEDAALDEGAERLAELDAYDISATTEARWYPQTMCGRSWSLMATAEDEQRLSEEPEPRVGSPYAPPTPRTTRLECIRCLDRLPDE